MKILSIILLLTSTIVYSQTPGSVKPLRVGIAGLTHGHVHWILRSVKDGDVVLAGVAEANRELAERLLTQYDIPLDVLFPTLDEMLDKVKPEAVTAFGSIYEHLAVVRSCAPRKIHVMVEKPLAVNLKHALEMATLAKAHNIQLLTNYETTWYGSNHKTYEMLATNKFGPVRKIVVHDGHQGPKEIGVNQEFLQWLTDPKQNGGGALMDFGCYGANLITWLMKGEKPLSVSAVTQQIKPDIYPKVDDEATIIVTYPKAQGIIQASWNWPYGRKDMEVYGKDGYIVADRDGIRYRVEGEQAEKQEKIEMRPSPHDDPFRFLSAVVRGTTRIDDHDLSSLAINLTAMEILDAATESARTGKVIHLKKRD